MNIPFREDFPPKNDIVFSIMFGEINLFARLLKCVTGHTLKAKEVISQASVAPDNVEHNYIRFDTFAKDENGTIYSIDLQNTYSEVLIKNRTIYYACRSIAGQTVFKGQYDNLNKVIVSFIMTRKKGNIPTEIVRLYNQNNELYSELFALYNVYVPTVNESDTDNGDLKIFSSFFSIDSEEKMMEFIDRYSCEDLGGTLIASYSKAICRKDLTDIKGKEYFDMKISEQDIMEAKIEAIQKGRAEGLKQGLEQGLEQGREQGLEQGLEQGREQGLEQGRAEERTNVLEKVKLLIKNGVSIDMLIETFNITSEERTKFAI